MTYYNNIILYNYHNDIVIYLTPAVNKVLELIVGSWILELVGKQLDDHQFGASTTHALVNMLHHWHRALNEGHSVSILFVNYAKANTKISWFSVCVFC